MPVHRQWRQKPWQMCRSTGRCGPALPGTPRCPAVLPHDPEPVGVIDEQPRAVLFLQAADLGKPRGVSLHAEYALGDHEDPALAVPPGGDQVPFQVLHVVVLEGVKAPAGGGEHHGIDHGRVRQRIDEHDVIPAHEGRDGSQHAEVAVIEDDRRLLAAECGEPPLKLDVLFRVAGEHP